MSNSEIHYGVRYIDSDHVSDFDTDAHRAAEENRVLNAKKVHAELVCRRVTYGTWKRAAYQVGPPGGDA